MSDLAVLRRLAGLAAPLRGRFALATLLGVGTLAASIGLMASSGLLISWASLQPPLLDLMVAITAVRALGISRAVLRYLERLASHDAALRLLGRVRARVVARVEALAPAGLEGWRRGDLVSRLVDDVESLQTVYVRALAPPLVALGAIAVALAIVVPLDPRAGAVLAAGLLGGGAAVSLLALRLGRAAGRRLAQARGSLATAVDDVLGGAGELLLYDRVEDHLARVDAADAVLADLQRREAWRAGLIAGASAALTGVTVVAVAAVAVPAVTAGTLPGVFLAVVVLTALAAFEAITPLPQAAQQLSDALGAARRVFAVLDAPDPVADPAEPRPRPEGRVLALEGATLRYDGADAPALVDVDLTVRRGERVALLGPSGAGKTTVAEALTRLRPLASGRATLDGVDLSALAGDDVREVVGLVEQQPHLFATTLRENLRLADREATDADLHAVLARVRLDRWVAGLPDGLDTEVGPGGEQVSGGQRQRLALARQLLRDPPLLLLDEPTADVDRVTAAALRRELLDAAAGRGVLLITHEAPGPGEVDRVVTLDGGRVVAEADGAQPSAAARGLAGEERAAPATQ